MKGEITMKTNGLLMALVLCASGYLCFAQTTAFPYQDNGPKEPETRTLNAKEADDLLRADWLFRMEGVSPLTRVTEEITWTRQMLERYSTRMDPQLLKSDAERVNQLEKDLNALSKPATTNQLIDLYLNIRTLKRHVMFKDPDINFSKLLFIDVPERYPHESMHRVYPQAQLNCGRLLMLDGLNPGGKLTRVAPETGSGWFWRPEVSFDAKKILFCFRPNGDRVFHLYEINVDGTGLRQLTSGSYDDMDPIYLPDGKIVFLTNRGNSYARCTVGHPSTLVARCDADGRNIYILSGGNEPEYTPTLLQDGRILYTRWEYTDKELMRIQSLWTVNPDGTGTSVYWGNQSYWPDMLMEAHPIPGDHRVMFAGHGHHLVYNASIGIVDRTKGLNYPDGLTKVTWDTPWAEVGNGPDERQETSLYHVEGKFGGYKSPYPLSKELFLVSARQRYRTVWGENAHPASTPFCIYLMDIYGNRELIYSGTYNLLYPMPVIPRQKPPIIPDQIQWAGAQKDKAPVKTGTFYSADIFQGAAANLREKGKFLRVLTIDHVTFTLGKKLQDVEHPGHPAHMHSGPVMSVTHNDGVKRVLGTVPIEADGSVFFEAPPCVSLHFQVLDENHRTLHTMRSFTNLMPGENRGCTGCHEAGSAGSVVAKGDALQKPPAKLKPYPMGASYSLGYVRDIQPILDTYCGKCHQGNGKGKEKLDLTLRKSADGGTFPEPYLTLTLGKKRQVRDFPSACEGGIADTILAEARPWKPEDYRTLPAMTKLSANSRLIAIASSGKHHDVKVDENSLFKLILWVDTLCPYRGEQEVRTMDDPDPEDPLFSQSNYPPRDPETVQDVYAQSPYRPRTRTAPLINRAYRQDEFPTVESRLPRDEKGNIIAPVIFSNEVKKVVNKLFRAPVAATAQSTYSKRGSSAFNTFNGSGCSSFGEVTTNSTVSTAMWSDGNDVWLNHDATNTWITFDLGQEVVVRGLHYWGYNHATTERHRNIQTAQIYAGARLPPNGAEYAQMGKLWGTLVDALTFPQPTGTEEYKGSSLFFSKPVKTRFLQLYVTSKYPGRDNYIGLDEVRFFCDAQ